MSDRLLLVSEVARRLGITEKAVRNRIERGTLPSIRQDGKVRVPLSAISTDDERDERIAEGIPSLVLLDDLKRTIESLGVERGRREIEAAARADEIELRDRVVQQTTRAEGLEAQLDKAERQIDRLLGELAELEAILTNRQRKRLKRSAEGKPAGAVEQTGEIES